MSDADMARAHAGLFRAAIAGAGVADSDPRMTGQSVRLPIMPQAPGLADRIWWGAGTRATGEWAAREGMNLMSSTLLTEDTGVPFDELQLEQIQRYKAAWAEAGWDREPRVIPLLDAQDRAYFGERSGDDQLGHLDGGIARFGKSYVGEPDVLAEELAKDVAVREADSLLLTVPNQLGVAYNQRLLAALAEHVLPAIGWKPRA
jgi:alkanesulfonate monooxygenase SsuD/methylene tetrahydromethanopterin reductase-like flavin-dependent oxidoreductase (luciferase family)